MTSLSSCVLWCWHLIWLEKGWHCFPKMGKLPSTLDKTKSMQIVNICDLWYCICVTWNPPAEWLLLAVVCRYFHWMQLETLKNVTFLQIASCVNLTCKKKIRGVGLVCIGHACLGVLHFLITTLALTSYTANFGNHYFCELGEIEAHTKQLSVIKSKRTIGLSRKRLHLDLSESVVASRMRRCVRCFAWISLAPRMKRWHSNVPIWILKQLFLVHILDVQFVFLLRKFTQCADVAELLRINWISFLFPVWS